MASKRHSLAQRRKSIGLSQETLAHNLGVERSTVARWERGETEPQPWVRPRIARALEISLEQLDILLGATANADVGSTSRARLDYDRTSVRLSQREPSEINDMNRRELLRMFSRVSVLVSVSPIEDALDLDRIERAAGRVGRLDAATVDEYAKLNGHLWRVFVLSASKAEVMPLGRVFNVGGVEVWDGSTA